MAKSNSFMDIQTAIDRFMRRKNLFFDFKIQRLKSRWNEIVGTQLNSHTRPDKIYKETLIVICDHQGWVNTLQFHKNDIINKINKLFGNEFIQVKDVKFIFKNKR